MKFLNEIDGASKLKQDSSNRLVTDAEKLTWNSKPDTDTVTTINGKTGAISKADIVALGINDGPIVDIGTFNNEMELITHVLMNQLPTGHYTFTLKSTPFFMLLVDTGTTYMGTFYDSAAQVHYFDVTKYGEIVTLKTIDLRDELTKSDIGLGSVDNVKQMPISGGILENYTEKLTTVNASGGSVDLSLGNVFVHTPGGSRTYYFDNAVNGQAHSFTLIVNMGSFVKTFTFPASVKWQGGEIPDMTTASKTYVLTFMTIDGGTNWLGMFGGEF